MAVALASVHGSFPSLLALHMADLGISQRELQRLTNLPIQTVSSAYHGRPGRIETYVTIAKALGLTLAQIAPHHAATLDGLNVY